MTIANWPDGPLPVLGDEQNVFYRTKTSTFNDGYKEISVSGINSKVKKGSLLFRALTMEQTETYTQFLDARAGVTPFNMVLPGDEDPTIILVKSYKLTTIGGFYREMSFEYEQFFPTSL